MTNEELKQKVLGQIKGLGISPRQYSRLNKKDKNHIFPICPIYIYNLARGKFDQCGRNGLLIMRDYFLNLENDKQND